MKIIHLYLEAHPINGFSHRSFVSKSTLHFLMLCVPLCIAVRLGKYIIAFRSLTCSNGTPATRFNLFWKKNWMVCAIDHVPRRIQCLMKNAISSDLYILIWTFKCTFRETYLKNIYKCSKYSFTGLLPAFQENTSTFKQNSDFWHLDHRHGFP